MSQLVELRHTHGDTSLAKDEPDSRGFEALPFLILERIHFLWKQTSTRDRRVTGHHGQCFFWYHSRTAVKTITTFIAIFFLKGKSSVSVPDLYGLKLMIIINRSENRTVKKMKSTEILPRSTLHTLLTTSPGWMSCQALSWNAHNHNL